MLKAGPSPRHAQETSKGEFLVTSQFKFPTMATVGLEVLVRWLAIMHYRASSAASFWAPLYYIIYEPSQCRRTASRTVCTEAPAFRFIVHRWQELKFHKRIDILPVKKIDKITSPMRKSVKMWRKMPRKSAENAKKIGGKCQKMLKIPTGLFWHFNEILNEKCPKYRH